MGQGLHPLQYQANTSRLHVTQGVPLKMRRTLIQFKFVLNLQQQLEATEACGTDLVRVLGTDDVCHTDVASAMKTFYKITGVKRLSVVKMLIDSFQQKKKNKPGEVFSHKVMHLDGGLQYLPIKPPVSSVKPEKCTLPSYLPRKSSLSMSLSNSSTCTCSCFD